MRVDFEGIHFELIMMGKLSPDPNWSIPAHSHRSYELHFVTEGTGINRVAMGEFALNPNTVYLAPPNEAHAQISNAHAPLGLYYMHFFIQIPGRSEPLPRIYAPYPYLSGEFETVYKHFYDERMDRRFKARLRTIELIWSTVRHYVEEHIPSKDGAHNSIERTHTGNLLLEQALLYIQSHFLRNPTLSEVASACYISERHLSRLFKLQFHLSVHELIQRERIRWAIAQLSQRRASIQSIAEQLHFSTLSYFSSWFKQWTSMSPMDYKRSSGNQ